MKLIDTHCHIHLMNGSDQEAAIVRAREAGVTKLVCVACDLKQVGECLPLTDKHDFIWTTAGIHPTDLNPDLERTLEKVDRYARNEKKVVAIGEIGLDYYHEPFDVMLQTAYLVGQLEIARMVNKPAIIHCRAGKNPGENARAFGDLITILDKMNFSNAVIHCFSGNAVEAEKLLDMGLMLSFTGIVTYPDNDALREVLRATPLDRMMIETDSPFLTPTAHRGKSNEPAFVVEVAKTIAEVKGLPLDEVARRTTENAERFFGI